MSLIASARDRGADPVPGRRATLRRRLVLGVPVDSCSTPEAVRTVERWVDERRGGVGMYVNAHLVNLASTNPALAEVLNGSSMNYADGMSIVWAARALGHRLPQRIALTYVIDDLAASWGRRGFSVFFLGGEPGCADGAADRLSDRNPGLRVAGTHHGYFSDSQSASIVAEINASDADILLVGLGNPRQEMWVAANAPDLKVGAVLTCGGLFDWVSGCRQPAPRWVGAIGLEWLYRWVLEPRRLFTRYLIGNPRFVLALLRELSAGRRAKAIVAPVPQLRLPDAPAEVVIDLRDSVVAQRVVVDLSPDREDAVDRAEPDGRSVV